MYINCIPVHKSQQQLYWNLAAAGKTIDFNDTSFAMGYKHVLECQCRKWEKVKDSIINRGYQTWNNQECSWILCIPPSAEAHHQTHLTGGVFGMTQKYTPGLWKRFIS